MLISLLGSAKDNDPKRTELSWADLQPLLSTHTITKLKKLDTPAWSPAVFDGKRSKKNVEFVSLLVLDIDKLSEQALQDFDKHIEGLDCILASTWSHAQHYKNKQTYSFRAVFRLDRPVSRDEFPLLWEQANIKLGGYGDPQCKDPSRLYFLPNVPTLEHAFSAVQSGEPLCVDEILKGAAPPPESTPAAPEPVTLDELKFFARQLSRRKSVKQQAFGLRLKMVLKGESFADPGERDRIAFHLACTLAERFPEADAGGLAQIFKPSLILMEKQHPEAPTLEIIEEKIRRKQVEYLAEKARAAQEENEDLSMRISRVMRDPDRKHPYTEAEYEAFAEEAGVSVAEFKKQLIIACGTSCYLFVNGDYTAPFDRSNLLAKAHWDLAPAVSMGFINKKLTRSGEWVHKRVGELVEEYGTVASKVIAVLGAEKSWYDAKTGTMFESVCKPRQLHAVHNKYVDGWLRALGGEQYPKLLDWIAHCPNLEEPSAALYLAGPPSTGKTLLPTGLARIWTEGDPTSLDQVLGTNFNGDWERCPLAFADEVLPENFMRGGNTGQLRELIQARNRPLKRKFLPNATLKNCVRVVMAANNPFLIDTQEDLTEDDINAITERIVFIEAGRDARDYLQKLPKNILRTFVEGDAIAQHALWLAENHTIKDSGGRFVVSGEDAFLSQSLTTRSGIRSAVCQWLVSYLQDKKLIDNLPNMLCRIHDGELLVQAKALTSQWEQYSTNTRPPVASKVSSALRGLSGEKGRRQVRVYGKPTQYWVIKKENLVTWAEQNGFSSREEIEAALAENTVDKGQGNQELSSVNTVNEVAY